MFAPRADPVRLRSDTRGIRVLLQMSVDYVVVAASSGAREFGVTTVAYEYRLTDTEGQEILAFHWHPQGLSRVTHPHLHLSGRLAPLQVGRGLDTIQLGDIHIPTGYVLPEDVVRLLIEELGVRSRLPDWDALLHANRGDALREFYGAA